MMVHVHNPTGRLDLPPTLDRRLAWPASLGKRFLVGVDVEEEFDWSRPPQREAQSVRAMRALPAAHQRFNDAGISPIYLVDYPVLADRDSSVIIAELAQHAEIGAQLHPWVNPPHDEPITIANSFVGNLPKALEAAKLAQLTALITEVAGRPPRVYRAGRYGIGPHSAELLHAAGYRLDLSTRPAFDYRDQAGPDYRGHPNWPWWAGAAGDLLAVPFTTAFTGRLRHHSRLYWRWPRCHGLFARTGLLNRVSLTPEGMPIADALAAVEALAADGAMLLNFSFHSPSLEPGHTPYVRSMADLELFWRWWAVLFDRLAALGYTALSTAELLAAVPVETASNRPVA
jgi:hypothetical protein